MNLSRVCFLPENWDRGINAFYTSYYASQYYSDYKVLATVKYLRAFHQRVKPAGLAAAFPMPAIAKPMTAAGWKSSTLSGRGIPQILVLCVPGYIPHQIF